MQFPEFIDFASPYQRAWSQRSAPRRLGGEAEEKARQRRQLGMSLLEMMIVLAILGMVTALIVGPVVLEQYGKAQVETATTKAKALAHQAYPSWRLNNRDRTCPKSIEELARFAPGDGIEDPWGNDYMLRCGESADEIPGGFGVVSAGADGLHRTDDDIRSWRSRRISSAQ